METVDEREESRARSARHQGGNPGWRPGAKWAKAQIVAEIERLLAHQHPPMREMGRRSEAAAQPFTGDLFADQPLRSAAPPVRSGGEGARPPGTRRAGDGPYPGEDHFFLTGRMSGDIVARACPDQETRVRVPSATAAGQPVVTVQRIDGNDVLVAVCPAARARGLHPGMWLTQARVTVRSLLILPADPDGDRAALHRLAIALARRWAPTVAVADDASLFMDLTGVSHLHGGERKLCDRLGALLSRLGYCNRLVISDTPGSAWAFARQLRNHDHHICAPGWHVETLEPLPVDALRLEDKQLDLLRRLGIDTVAELAALPRGPLAKRFGGALVRRLDQATGRAPEPLHPVVPPEHIAIRRAFAEPIASAEAIEHWLRLLVPDLCVALAEAGRGARALDLVAERVDGAAQVLRVGLARPTRDPTHLLRLLVRRVEEIAPGFGLDALALHVRRSEPLSAETLAPALADEPEPDLATLVDLLVSRLNGRQPWRAAPVESDVPERSVARVTALEPPARAAAALRPDDVRRLDARASDPWADHPWHPRWPRPVRLLPHPERVEHVLAELPDQPPRRFTWRGVSHRVVRADGPERIAGEWWRRAAEDQAVRDYFSVEDESGRRFWLFRRGDSVRAETGDLSWHLHGLYA